MSSNIFSIELFIDRIRILEGEKCIFPSTVLKLLDYEPTLISTVEYDVQSKLREYINLTEKSNNVKKITQINELKDTDGNYVIRKGKSVLFDGNTLTLISEFNALPLYILICDDYFYPNHLVGVVTIKLSDLMTNLAKKISKVNHTVNEEIMGKFPIANLIGNGVGFITLKLRLIFIGANLTPHLQEEQHIEVRTKSNTLNPVEKSIECGDQIIEESKKILVRNIGCQVNKTKAIRIQVPTNPTDDGLTKNNLAKVGLTIDPNDPILVDHPPMIYNSYYGNGEESDSEPEEPNNKVSNKIPPENSLSNIVKSLSKSPERDSILNALLNELKAWKSEKDLEKNPEISVENSRKLPPKPVKTNRSKSVDRTRNVESSPRKEERKEFIRRISQPKIRAISPLGIVPKEKGWLRKEPEYSGPIRSQLEYKLTKTQVKRIELRNPSLFRKIIKQKLSNDHDSDQRKPDQNVIYSSDFTSPSHTPIPRVKRNPLVPPLFGSGTSISVPSFTMSGSAESQQSEIRGKTNKKIHKRPPQSPGKENHHFHGNNRNNNNNNHSRSFSYDTNETVNEADQYLNLNPVQSNRSPHMSRRSNHVAVDSEENSYDYQNNRTDSENSEYISESYGNKDAEYSDKFNQSYSTENDVAKSPSRRYSVASQISQTSEWRTDYSIESSNSQSNNHKIESSNPSLNNGVQKLPVKVPVKQRLSSSSNGVRGSGFPESVGTGSYLSAEYERPSFNESLEVSNMDSFVLPNDYSRQSFDQNEDNNSMLRPNSIGADVTSFTKVTKYERSLVPGHMNSNHLGTHLITSTVGSLRTDDSQILTSESYY